MHGDHRQGSGVGQVSGERIRSVRPLPHRPAHALRSQSGGGGRARRFQGRLDGIRVQERLSPGLPPILVDAEQFKRVVVNLVDNAAEAMQNSLVKELYIATRTGAGDTVELVVTHTGCGVSAEGKKRLVLA